MKFNKSHLQIKVVELEKCDWSINENNKIRYKRYFDAVAPILDPENRKNLNERIKLFCDRWELSLMESEKLIYAAFFRWMGEPIRKKKYFHKIIGGRTQKTWQMVDISPNMLENDLTKIRLWCALKVIEICQKNELNFEELVRIDGTQTQKQ